MLRFFKKKSKQQKLHDTYRDLLKQAHNLSTSNRRESDAKYAEAEAILKEIEKLKKS